MITEEKKKALEELNTMIEHSQTNTVSKYSHQLRSQREEKRIPIKQ